MQPSTRGTTSKARDPSGDLDTAVGEALLPGVLLGFVVYALVRILLRGFYTVDQNERAVKTVFGRAQRVGQATTLDLPSAQALRPDERERYVYPQAVVIPPGGPYFKWPWEKIHKVNVATTTMNLAHDPDNSEANDGGTRLDAVTKDHLNTKIVGQLRFRVAEENLYAFLFGVKGPISHVMGYFVSVLRQRIASFEAPARALLAPGEAAAQGLAAQGGVSINDLRKNLRELNDHMEADCASSAARYGVLLDACLITGIDPPDEVESALAAINTAHNHVSSELSLAHAAADQRIVQSRRAVEIETLQVQAEAEPLQALSRELVALDASGPGILEAYVRNQKLALLARARRVFLPAGGAPLPRIEARSVVHSGDPVATLGGRDFTPAEGPPMTARLGARTGGQ